MSSRTFADARLVLGFAISCALLTWSGRAHSEPPAQISSSSSIDAARARYDAGAAAYAAGQYQRAIQEFREADRIAPRPALSFNIARAYDKLGDEARALEFFRQYLRRDPNAKTATETRARITALEAVLQARGVQQLSVYSSPPGASLRIDDRLVGVTPWTGELAPGKHRLSLTAPGSSETTREIDLPRAEAMDVDMSLGPEQGGAPVPTRSPVSSGASSPPGVVASEKTSETARFGVWPWVAIGAGGAALVTSLGFELSRRSAEEEAENTPHRDFRDYQERYETMESRKTTARVFLGVGGALMIAGGVLVYLDQSERASVALDCGPATCGGRWEHRF
jgi:tetratricopeptide (TPR) repeat protein